MISERLRRVILHELNVPDIELRDDMLATEVPGWDSLTHVSVLAAVEKEFGIRFAGLEIMRLKNLGDLQKLVAKKTGTG
ncbi:MAG: acyl carrier protein [Polyangiaceae bacterium]|nr:acyl carrier protein [Polyangiaceae bacterium]